MLLQIMQVACLFLVACTMTFSLAHAAELPGKMRLDKAQYLAVQPIYHPGFTIGGIGEPLAILALAWLVLLIARDGDAFALSCASLALVVGMQAIYWLAIHPVNKFWLADRPLPKASAGFFGFGRALRDSGSGEDWKRLRNRWEYAHAARAVLAVLAFVLLCIDVVF
jgi:uncharacterized membrane protein YfbV (UPF0208 family)